MKLVNSHALNNMPSDKFSSGEFPDVWRHWRDGPVVRSASRGSDMDPMGIYLFFCTQAQGVAGYRF